MSFVATTRLVGKGHFDGRTLVSCSFQGADGGADGNADGDGGGAVAPLVIDVREDWAPLGATRFLELVSSEALDGTALFRAVQVGAKGDAVVVEIGVCHVGESTPRLSEQSVP